MSDSFKKKLDGDSGFLKWKSGKRTRRFDCAIFSVDEVERTNHDGRHGSFVQILCPEWIIIVPVYTDEDGVRRVIVEKQYRHGSDSVTLEYPAGLVEKGEDPMAAARRELLEETGLEAGRVMHLGTLCPNNAFMSNHQHFYLAEDLRLAGSQDLDPNEEIEVYSLPLDEVLSMMGGGMADNALMLAASFLVEREFARREKEN